MATKFLEPGGDATFNVATTTNGGFWRVLGGTPPLATDFVHGSHLKSIQFQPNLFQIMDSPLTGSLGAGGRFSVYVYFVALPNADATFIFDNSPCFHLRITSAGLLKLTNGSNDAQLGIGTHTISTGQWYRISIAFTTVSTTVNRFEVFLDGNSDISVTNATLTTANPIGNSNTNTTLDFRVSDIYVDDSSSLTDTGDIWVVAKRPNANGTTNGFSTQIGAGGSGYGTGHSPQVNERPLSTTNGWSMVGAGSTVTEEYTIENKSTGDFNISNSTTWDLLKEDGSNILQESSFLILLENENQNAIVDICGWAYMSSLVGETVQMIVGGVNFSLTFTINCV